MIHSLKGILTEKQTNSFAVEIGLPGQGGVSFLVKSSQNVVKSLPETGSLVKVFTYLHVREDALELYGFLNKEELSLFEMLIGISGIGPKSALGILGVESPEKIRAAIAEGRAELLTKASGVGRKTADRIILELRNKMVQAGSEKIVGIMESDYDLAEALVNLGYTRTQVKTALSKVSPKTVKLEDRLKEALKFLKNV